MSAMRDNLAAPGALPRPAGPRPASGTQLRAAPALLTVDVEDYYQVAAFERVVRREDWAWYPSRVESNVSRILDILDEYCVRGTFFVLGWEARRRPAMVRRIAERGHEVACHSMWHRRITDMTPAEFGRDTREALDAIEHAAGRRVIGYRAPSFSIVNRTLWALDVLIECGLRYDSSIFPVLHPQYGIPEAPGGPHRIRRDAGEIWELPPAAAAFAGRRWPVAGGAYLRHLPLTAIGAGLDALTGRERLPAMLYLHPWEIDPGQPRLAGSALTRIRHYRGLASMEARLRWILGRYRVVPVGELLEQLERSPDPLAEKPWCAPALQPGSGSALVLDFPDQPKLDQLWADALRSSGRTWLVVLGVSMVPTLCPGDKVLVELSGHYPGAGEIAVFFDRGKPIIHRVLAVRRRDGELVFLQEGDAGVGRREIPASALIGRVVAAERRGRVFRVRSRRVALPVSVRWMTRSLAKRATAKAKSAIAAATAPD
ncbi:MAG: DUF3473 domain-containing protein [Acidobacteria bacterium]|nr:DUF3473 domain-containing protein [Acidobacteriota bacterium]